MKKLAHLVTRCLIIGGLTLTLAACGRTETPVTTPVDSPVTDAGQVEITAGSKIPTDITLPSGQTKIGSDEEPDTSKAPQVVVPGGDTFLFVGKGVEFTPTQAAAPILEALGPANSVYEAPSCVFAGTDQVYAYDGFEVNTCDVDGINTIVGMFLTDTAASTPEGITYGSSLSEVLEVYGEPDEESVGQMTWQREKSQLVIVILDDAVTSISYIGEFEDAV